MSAQLITQKAQLEPFSLSLEDVIFFIFLSCTVLFRNWFFVNSLAWVAVCAICLYKKNYAIYAAFFYSAFFIKTGLLENPLLTVKHFHIAMTLVVIAMFIHKRFLSQQLRFRSICLWASPWIVMALTSFLGAQFSQDHARVLLSSANLLSLVGAMIVLSLAIESKTVALRALMSLLVGGCVRIFIAVISLLKAPSFVAIENPFYNNQLSFLMAPLIFLAISSLFISRRRHQRLLLWIVLMVLFTGLLATCSRTGWLSTLVTSVFFFWAYHYLCKKKICEPAISLTYFAKWAFVLLSLCAGIAMLLSFDVFDRIVTFKRMFSFYYWKYTFVDKHNFHFFGQNRLRQFYVIKDLVSQDWLLGVGLSRQVTNLHSLYLSLLGATGLIGLAAFLVWVIAWARQSFHRLLQVDDGFHVIRLGIISFVAIWVLFSFMENYIMQFHIWTILAAGTVLICNRDRASEMSTDPQGVNDIEQ